jgi:aspartate ammonia-lyase
MHWQPPSLRQLATIELRIVKKAQSENKTIREVMLEDGIPKDEVDRILDLKRMTKGGKLQTRRS